MLLRKALINSNFVFWKLTWGTFKSELTDLSPLVSELRPYPQLLGYGLPVQITVLSSDFLQPLHFLLSPFLFVDAWMLRILPKPPQFFWTTLSIKLKETAKIWFVLSLELNHLDRQKHWYKEYILYSRYVLLLSFPELNHQIQQPEIT